MFAKKSAENAATTRKSVGWDIARRKSSACELAKIAAARAEEEVAAMCEMQRHSCACAAPSAGGHSSSAD